MGLIILIILSIIFVGGFIFGLIEIIMPNKFFHFACKHSFLRFFYKKIYQIESPLNTGYHRFIGVFSIVFVFVLCLSTGYKAWEITVPEERNLSDIVNKAHHAELEYHGELSFLNIYGTDTVPLENDQWNEIKGFTEDIHIGFYNWITSYPKKRYDGGLDFTYEYDPPKYVSVILKDTNDDEIGSIKMFSKDKAYYVNQDNQSTPLKGNFEELYHYLIGLKNESD